MTRCVLEERASAWRPALTPLHGCPPPPSSLGIRVLVLWAHPGPEEQQRTDTQTDVVDLRAAEANAIGVEGAIAAETRSTWLKDVTVPHPFGRLLPEHPLPPAALSSLSPSLRRERRRPPYLRPSMMMPPVLGLILQ